MATRPASSRRVRSLTEWSSVTCVLCGLLSLTTCGERLLLRPAVLEHPGERRGQAVDPVGDGTQAPGPVVHGVHRGDDRQ